MIKRSIAALACAMGLMACESRSEEARRAAAMAGLEAYAGEVVALGAAPYWRVDLASETGIRFAPPNAAPMTSPYQPPFAIDGGAAFVARDLRVFVKVEPCTDGRSAVAYPMSAYVTHPGARGLRGCAYPRWTNELEALIPAIDACLAATPDRGAVTYAAQQPDAAILVRVEGPGGRFQCAVAEGVASVEPILVDAPFAGERDPVFHRGAKPNGCVAAAPVGDLGWTTTPGACG